MRNLLRPVSIAVPLVLASSLIQAQCLPEVPRDDADLMAWARQAYPAVLGRPARGYVEVQALAALAQATDKRTAALALMERPEFTDYWTEVLADLLRAHRTTPKNLSACLSDGSTYNGTALAEHIRDHGPVDALPTSWDAPPGYDLDDVFRSSVALDDLFPAMRAYLVATATHPNTLIAQEDIQLADQWESFSRAFLHRNQSCLPCHNSEFSVTGEATRNPSRTGLVGTTERVILGSDGRVSEWDRTQPIALALETAAFGSTSGRDPKEMYAMLRAGSGTAAWGMPTCGSVGPAGAWGGLTQSFAGSTLPSTVSIVDLDRIFAQGVHTIRTDGIARELPDPASCEACEGCPAVPPTADPRVSLGTIDATLRTNCGTSCHTAPTGYALVRFDDGGWPEDLVRRRANVPWDAAHAEPTEWGLTPQIATLRVLPHDVPRSTVRRQVGFDYTAAAGVNMPRGGSEVSGLQAAFDGWIGTVPVEYGCRACASSCSTLASVPGAQAFAYLAALDIVDSIWAEVMGSRLTIVNYFPRNEGQRDILWHLTEIQFLGNDWSLKQTLATIVASEYFARKNPAASTRPAYEEPMAFDPWVQADLRTRIPDDPQVGPTNHPELHHNGVGDQVHKKAPRALVHGASEALGWTDHVRFPSETGTAYPSIALYRALGGYLSDAEPGMPGLSFQGLLEWEAAVGNCDPPGDDWIDALDTAARATSSFTALDAVLALKDRLINDPTIYDATEETALRQAFRDVSPPSTTFELDDTAQATGARLEPGLRRICGAMLVSPQYVMAGISPGAMGSKPAIQVFRAAEPTRFRDYCDELGRGLSASVRLTATCGATSVSVPDYRAPARTCGCQTGAGGGCASPPASIEPFPRGAELACPDGLCGVVPMPAAGKCLEATSTCAALAPPPCDPRCRGLTCCGDPAEADARDAYVWWADGAQVDDATGVDRAVKNDKGLEPVGKGATLAAGDVLVLSPESSVALHLGDQKWAIQPGDVPKDGPRVVVVTGPKVVSPERSFGDYTVMRPADLDRLQRSGELPSMTAGPFVDHNGVPGFAPEQ